MKYERRCIRRMSSKNRKEKPKMKPIIQVVNLFHRVVELIASGVFSLIAYFCHPKECQPPIKNRILLYSASTLAAQIRQQEITSEEVVQAYIDRINEIQPILNCVVEGRFEEALEEARKCDKMLRSSNAPSIKVLTMEKPFLGVPFTTKDCIAIAGMKQTAGLVVRKNTVSDRDAETVKLMRAAGAIPIAKTNVSELAMWWESSNCIYGTSRNPYNTRHIVGGSSGGEGALIAAAGSPFGIGSDIGGSIRMPCFFNGIFGHKTTRGVVSNEGQYPSPHHEEQDVLLSLGPMCRNPFDLIPMLRVLAGKNASMLNLDSKVDLSKLKIYYMEDDGGQLLVSPVEPEIKEAMYRVIDYFARVHKVKAKKVDLKKMKKSTDLWLANMSTKDARGFAYELSNRTGVLNIWWKLAQWFTFMGPHTLIALITVLVESFGIKFGSEKHTKLIQQSRDLYLEFKDMLDDGGIFLYPTHPTAAPMHHEPLIKPFNFSYTAIINVLGVPSTACPLGLNQNGLPIGIQVIGGMYQDHLTLAVAEEIGRAFGGWVPPPLIENGATIEVPTDIALYT
ncbi:fatty-acid amide hydrolase 2-A isoform X2 [Neodiprion pinetum]|uniref:fatty-acid amide hydrolase 2-A isoform X1 n=1 Tax=Neodiprion fabricii TaxID=2872261 RepID=UPI001ED8E1ED|nr:fatty-acid amide hydrolase 2-A isoform X1 [Neodiprion fabricii]XP_046492749.1 fatty-acid amide hydrolase 2-A isoform X1 [Neodiprion pinetum]